jgi:hypothetical protein
MTSYYKNLFLKFEEIGGEEGTKGVVDEVIQHNIT